MKNYVGFISGLFFLGALLPGQLVSPQLGVAHFADGSLRIVRGIPANLLTGRQSIAVVEAASFGSAGGLVSSGGTLALLRADGTRVAEYGAGEAEPVLNVDGGLTSAVAWLPAKHMLVRWNGSAFEASAIDDAEFGGRIVFVGLSSPNHAAFFVEHADATVSRILVFLPAGRLVSSDIVPAAHGPVFVQQGWVVWQDAHGLVAESAGGARQTMRLSDAALPDGDLRIERMSSDWLHVASKSSGTSWGILLTSSRLQVSLMPPPRVEVAQ